MNEKKIDVIIEAYEDGYKTAMFHTYGPLWKIGVKGCPCGSGRNLTDRQVVQDLLDRTNMESKTSFKFENIEIIKR